MTAQHHFPAATLALFGLLCVLPAQAKESHDEEGRGDLEHYHHEYYSHSFIDPNYHDDQGAAFYKAPHHKGDRHYGRPDVGATFAFGGHRRKRH